MDEAKVQASKKKRESGIGSWESLLGELLVKALIRKLGACLADQEVLAPYDTLLLIPLLLIPQLLIPLLHISLLLIPLLPIPLLLIPLLLIPLLLIPLKSLMSLK